MYLYAFITARSDTVVNFFFPYTSSVQLDNWIQFNFELLNRFQPFPAALWVEINDNQTPGFMPHFSLLSPEMKEPDLAAWW